MPEISVIVPIYKTEKYLKVCLDSILAQSFLDYELILVDDGSPDHCPAICDEYAQLDPRIKVIHQENMGLSGARNSGLDAAIGEYVTFIDSDDLISEDYLHVLYNDCLEYGVDISCCSLLRFTKDSEFRANSICQTIGNTVSGKEACYLLYTESNIPLTINAWGKLYKRDLIKDLRFPEGRIHEDQAFVPIALYKSSKVRITGIACYWYRSRPDSIITSTFSNKRYDNIWAIDSCIEFYEQQGEIKIAEAAITIKELALAKYAIMAYHDGIRPPTPYKMSIKTALHKLNGAIPEEKYLYFLGLAYPRRVIFYEYKRKLKKILNIHQD